MSSARRGMAWRGLVWPGEARQGRVFFSLLARQGPARLGKAWLGEARRGLAWQGGARQGKAGKDKGYKMNMNFKPTRADGRSYRDVALDVFKNGEPESLVPYQTVADALGLDPMNDLHKIQMAVRSANSVLLKLHSRGVKNIPNFGYRILPAREHMLVANSHQTKADKAMGRSIMFFEGANLGEMTEQERKTHEGLSMIAHQLSAMHTYNKTRFDRLESLFKGPIIDQ